jgi:phage tail-like protein
MTCGADFAKFRLLDALVGWDPDVVQGLDGLDSVSGITLAPLAQQPDDASISRVLPPSRLARGCGPCEWYLVTCCPPQSRLLRLDPCASEWRSPWVGACAPDLLRCATAVAVHCDDVAVADPGAGRVWLWRRRGAELAAAIAMAHPGPVAWAPWGEWLVADLGALRLRRFDRGGRERADAIPLPGTADRLGVHTDGRVWLVTREEQLYRIWMWRHGEERFHVQAIDALLGAFPDSGVRSAGGRVFCLGSQDQAASISRCFDCHGRPASMPEGSSTPTPAPTLYEKKGQLLTVALDSGIPRGSWHRVRIDADVPAGTDVSVAVSTQEDAAPAPQGASVDAQWAGFAPGVPHADDWNSAPHGTLDYTISQPAGRYLFLRLRLEGDGAHTPVVRRIRIDFPRQTSLDNLPAVYRDNPQAESFTERFLALFDAAIEDIDRAIERFPALLDAGAVQNEVLPWLGSFLDVAMDPAWTTQQRRAVLAAVPELYLLRGTGEGLRRTLKLLFGVDAVIDETAMTRQWGALGKVRLDGVRLFGRSRSRMRVGRSALSQAPVWSVGDPDLDPLNAGAFRFRVLVPRFDDDSMRQQISAVVESQKPAHTLATVYGGGSGPVVGEAMHIGVDTALVALPPPVLGRASRGVRLNRDAVLWSTSRCSNPPLHVGSASAIGIKTVME